MKISQKSKLNKVNEIIFSKDFNFEKLIKKSVSIFSQEIETIISFTDQYLDLLEKKSTSKVEADLIRNFDLPTFIKSRLKPIILIFSFNSYSIEVYKTDFYNNILYKSLNNKSILLDNIDLKTIISSEKFNELVYSLEKEKLLDEIFESYFKSKFSEIITDKMLYYSNIINKFSTENSMVYELNSLFLENKLPLSILNNEELKDYIKLAIDLGKFRTIFSDNSYQNLDDENLKNNVKKITMDIISECYKEKNLEKLKDSFSFATTNKLFINNLSYLKSLKTILELCIESNNYDLSFKSIGIFSDVFLEPILRLKEVEIEEAKNLLKFIVEKELFYENFRFSQICIELSKMISNFNQTVSINATMLFFSENFKQFIISLVDFNILKNVKLTIAPQAILKLFIDQQLEITNDFVNLYKKEKIKFSLNKEAEESLNGLIIGMQNGLVISEEKTLVERRIKNFISLFE